MKNIKEFFITFGIFSIAYLILSQTSSIAYHKFFGVSFILYLLLIIISITSGVIFLIKGKVALALGSFISLIVAIIAFIIIIFGFKGGWFG